MFKIFMLTAFWGLLLMAGSCQSKHAKKSRFSDQVAHITPDSLSHLDVAYFASGCFWCVEAVYESVIGVQESISGYAGGHTDNPTYASSNTGKTGHAEAVAVYYNTDLIDFATLLEVYFSSQNITQVNGQGPDRGSQYRSIIFYQTPEEKNIIDDKILELNESLAPERVAAEVKPFDKFWLAEDYHQNYERLHPNNSYIKGVSIPRLKRFQEKHPELIKPDARVHD